ncbi:hypothetical protein ACKAV7_004788 [Fusarium commune]
MGVFDSLDAGVTNLFGQWNVYSTGLVTLLLAVVSYRVISTRDPDVHPMLLARQAVPSSVRNEGESPIYRSQAAPHGMPLNTGLNVKDTGASKWSRGRDGDLRDIWKRAAEGGENGAKGRILTVLGSQNVVDHKLDDITRQINLIGQHIAETGGIRVAVYLPNSVELLDIFDRDAPPMPAPSLPAIDPEKTPIQMSSPFGRPEPGEVEEMAKVAGAICQTALYDYRLPVDAKTHFGPPLTSVELYLKDAGAHKTTDEKIEGHIVVRGPSVAGGEVNVGIPGKIRHDNTLAYA